MMWERYRPDGTQVTAPQLGAGMIDPVPGADLGEIIDVTRVGDAIVLVSETSRGILGTRYDLAMRQTGQPSFLSPYEQSAAITSDGERLWLATQESYVPGALREGRYAVLLAELAPSVPPMHIRGARVTDPAVGFKDIVQDVAYDPLSGTLAALYGRTKSGSQSGGEIRLAIVDAGTLKPLRDVVVADAVGLDDPTSIAVTARDGTALVFWRTGGTTNHHLARVDVRSGSVTPVFEAAQDDGIACLRGNNRDLEFVDLPDGPALLFHDPLSTKGATDPQTDRFVLQPLDENGIAGEPIVLNGGQPVLADVTFDLASLASNPKKAICGSPCLLTGTVANRGAKPARDVVIETEIAGASLGTIEVGTLGPGDTMTFAKVWDVPPDLEAEDVGVTHTLMTSVEQYTLGNDIADTTVAVRQKGLIQGRVTNASGVIDPGWWAGGLPGAEVSFNGRSVLSDAAGCFAIEDVEFGSGTLTATKEGFNPASIEVETTRTRPIASAGFRMDDHGTLRIRVTDQETGKAVSGVQVYIMGYPRTDKTDSSGEVAYNIPKGPYLFAFKKSGYHAISPTEFSVGLGKERTASVVMRPATTASLTGRVVDRKGKGVEGATVRILDYKDEQVAAPTVDSEGVFSIADLPVKPSGNYAIAATGDGVTVTEPVSLTGGEVTSVTVKLIPGRGELAERVATEGYTSWMIKAGWPGFMDVGGQSIYVWYGNYAIRLGAQYWDGSRELNRVDVTAWGGKYETHCTKGEIEFKVTGDDLTGKSGKKLPPPMGQATDAASQSWWKSTAKKGYELYEKHKDAINLGKEILTGAKKVKEAWDDQDQWIILGQGPELLTWKEALEDFATRPSWDSDHPLDSVKSFIKAIPKSFAIPIVIGGSSVQETAVRVDGIDVVDKETGEVHRSDRAQWYSYDDLTGDGTAFKSYEIEQSGVSAEDVRILVWIRVQKYWQGRPGGTCFSEREQQVIVFDPGTGGIKAFIAPGDLYKNPDRWTTDYISRLAP